jgi:sporulation protein YlmC with PRC-barrel domain
MKKLLILAMATFALGIFIASSYADWMGGQSTHTSLAGEQKYPQSKERSSEYQASTIINSFVKNQKGEYLGRVMDLMIDPQNREISFAVLSAGGVLGVPTKYVAVPFNAFTTSDEKNVYLLDMTREKLAAAPSFSRQQWPFMANREWEGGVYRYYGQNPPWGDANEPAGQTWENANTFYQIVGTPVKNEQGETLGRMRDLVIDSQGHIHFAVLSHGGLLGIGGKLVAVPITVLNFEEEGKAVVLNSTKAQLDSAPAFKASNLSDKNWAEEMYRYFGQQPFWTE